MPIFRVKSVKIYTGQKNLHEYTRGARDKYEVWQLVVHSMQKDIAQYWNFPKMDWYQNRGKTWSHGSKSEIFQFWTIFSVSIGVTPLNSVLMWVRFRFDIMSFDNFTCHVYLDWNRMHLIESTTAPTANYWLLHFGELNSAFLTPPRSPHQIELGTWGNELKWHNLNIQNGSYTI